MQEKDAEVTQIFPSYHHMAQILSPDIVIQTQLKLEHGSGRHLIFASEGWYDLCKVVTL